MGYNICVEHCNSIFSEVAKDYQENVNKQK